jgi:hypothetical protein
LDRQTNPRIGDLPDGELEQRLAMSLRDRGRFFDRLSSRSKERDDEVALISLRPDKLIPARLSREIPFNNLPIDAALSEDEARQRGIEKKTAISFHDMILLKRERKCWSRAVENSLSEALPRRGSCQKADKVHEKGSGVFSGASSIGRCAGT